MYNRYVPQADGSFRRDRVPEPEAESVPAEQAVRTIPETAPEHKKLQSNSRNIKTTWHQRQMPSAYRSPAVQETMPGNIGGFLKGLLPKNFDTEDLIVVLLLLLISGNSAKDQNAALMTLGIYLFL